MNVYVYLSMYNLSNNHTNILLVPPSIQVVPL